MTTMTEQSSVGAPTFVAQAFRFSDDPPAMRTFLEVLGLGLLVSEGDSWFDLRGRSGAVALHGTRQSAATEVRGGQTDLVMIAADARSAAEYLESKGLSARVWDESFGLQAAVDETPLGREVWINEEATDFYGKQQHEPRPGPIDVVIVFFTDDLAEAATFFGPFGFAADEHGDDDCQALRNGDRGVINLHRSHDGQAPGTVGMSFETSEPLTAIADRLTAAGYQPSLLEDPTRVAVTDPDGELVEIWPAPASTA